jgi:hypothetical protein
LSCRLARRALGRNERREEAMAALRDAVETYLGYVRDTGREDEILRSVPAEPAKPRDFEAIPLECACAA